MKTSSGESRWRFWNVVYLHYLHVFISCLTRHRLLSCSFHCQACMGFLQFDSVTMTRDASKFLHGKWKTSRHLIFPVRIYSSWKLAAFTQISFSRPAVSRVSWIRNIDVDGIWVGVWSAPSGMELGAFLLVCSHILVSFTQVLPSVHGSSPKSLNQFKLFVTLGVDLCPHIVMSLPPAFRHVDVFVTVTPAPPPLFSDSVQGEVFRCFLYFI